MYGSWVAVAPKKGYQSQYGMIASQTRVFRRNSGSAQAPGT